MTTEVKPPQSAKNSDPASMTFWERVDAENRAFAKKLNDAQVVYALYGCLDGFSLSYSFFAYCVKAFFDSENSSDKMHEILTSPAGMAVMITESIAMVGFSLFANVFKDDDKNPLKRYIAVLWPYFRDAIKGLKNAYKGVQSFTQILSVVSGENMNFLLLPTALVAGAFSIFNRIWYRYLLSQRKGMMKHNRKALEALQKMDWQLLDQEKIASYREELQKQEEFLSHIRYRGLISQAYSGIIDGLYLYMGVMSVSVFAAPVFITLAVFSSLYVALCIATRMYEEHDYQRKLRISKTKVELALCGRELEAMVENFCRQNAQVVVEGYEQFKEDLSRQLILFNNHRQFLYDNLKLGYSSAALAGLKNGLAAYGVIASLLFAAATVSTMCGVMLSPVVVIVAVASGIACLLGFLIHALVKNYFHASAQESYIAEHPANSKQLLKQLKENESIVRKLAQEPEKDKFKQEILDDLVIDLAVLQFNIQEWTEVGRSGISGLSKAQKAFSILMVAWQKQDEKGHYQDTAPMFWATALGAVLYCTGFALRAYARGFGKPPLDDVGVFPKHSNSSKWTSSEDDTYVTPQDSASPISEPNDVVTSELTPSCDKTSFSVSRSPSLFFNANSIARSRSENYMKLKSGEQDETLDGGKKSYTSYTFGYATEILV
ncbi:MULTISPECIES: hypothetical protein [Legionella]|uniref:Transmembrane protein n=1 Tax=Legionella septentrionalis TaxID=2498109 RepID=A0A3S0XHU3_9GAMM|nr:MULTISPECIES: hypothetical protein [Legionella]MCP0914786.1 hypothetical protein [Legionella sp. 27cVA30]RUQ91079.1 hypothetical protein EKM59_00945 [Legionella septentrionalis]RUR02852.1 hypothetical protein ELY11_00400 [Legionella septentrionalis]RUR11450.1 hypothetical protein ELY14_01510 [Legionella septentrionalis]